MTTTSEKTRNIGESTRKNLLLILGTAKETLREEIRVRNEQLDRLIEVEDQILDAVDTLDDRAIDRVLDAIHGMKPALREPVDENRLVSQIVADKHEWMDQHADKHDTANQL